MKNRYLALMSILTGSMILLSGSFFAGYTTMQSFFAVPEEIGSYILSIKNGELPDALRKKPDGKGTGSDARIGIPPVRRDLYVFLDGERKVQKIVIGKLEAAKGTARLITVPLDTKLSLSDEMYRTLSAEFPAMPQLFRLSVLSEYVNEDRMGELLALIFSEQFSCRFDGVWIWEKERYQEWFDCDKNPVELTEKAKEYLELLPATKQILTRLTSWEEDLRGGNFDGNSDENSEVNSDGDSNGNSDGNSGGNSEVNSDGNSDGDSNRNSDGNSNGNSDGNSNETSDGNSNENSDGNSNENSDGNSIGMKVSLKRYAETIAFLRASDVMQELICGRQEAEEYRLDEQRAAWQLGEK